MNSSSKETEGRTIRLNFFFSIFSAFLLLIKIAHAFWIIFRPFPLQSYQLKKLCYFSIYRTFKCVSSKLDEFRSDLDFFFDHDHV